MSGVHSIQLITIAAITAATSVARVVAAVRVLVLCRSVSIVFWYAGVTHPVATHAGGAIPHD